MDQDLPNNQEQIQADSAEVAPPHPHHSSLIKIVGTLALVAVIGSVVFLFLQNQSLKKELGRPTLKLPGSNSSCTYNGQTYGPGEGFTASDGCNSCSCGENGQVACTAMACLDDDELSQSETDGWETYSTDEYSFKYPNGVEVSAMAGDESVVRAVYMGPTQKSSGRTQTELFDGYMLIVTKVDSDNSTSQQDLAVKVLEQERVAAKDICGKEIKNTPIIQDQIGGNTAEQFSYEGCSGIIFHSFITHDGNQYQITQAYYGDNQSITNYQNTSNQILSTFEFNSGSDKTSSIPLDWRSQNMTTEGASDHFKNFTIYYPPDWIMNKSEYPYSGFDLTLSKNDTKISIRQGEFGWGTCSFSDNYIAGEGMTSQMTQVYPDIQLDNNVIWRIAKPSNDIESEYFSVCQLNPHSSDGYNERFMGATQIGMISITNADNAELGEITQIFSRVETIE